MKDKDLADKVVALGFGNAFVEAVFAKKPIAVFEYPVFKADIKKEGYKTISFGDKSRQHNGPIQMIFSSK